MDVLTLEGQDGGMKRAKEEGMGLCYLFLAELIIAAAAWHCTVTVFS